MESSSDNKPRVFATKHNAASGGVEIVDPEPGRQGWREEADGTFTEVFFDKGGTGRTAYEKGRIRSTFEMKADWVNHSELAERKLARSRYWKKAKGPAVYDQARHRAERLLGRGGYIGMYGGDAWA